MTHLFADGGRIVKSTRTDYSEHLERDDMAPVVKNMMKEQHKAMFVALRSGELDEIIGFDDEDPVTHAGIALKPLAEQFVDEVRTQAGVGQPIKAAPLTPNEAGSVADVSSSSARIKVIEADDTVQTDGPHAVLGPPEAKPYAPSRPASIFSVPPPNSTSIFGEVGIDEKSLDDAILSYLAEDEDAGAAKK
jgi:hypothetical protein